MNLHPKQEAAAMVATPGLDGTLRLDSFNASAFELALRKLIDECEGDLILDLRSVSFVSSAGLRVVLIAAKVLREQNRRFRLCSLSKPVQHIFSISGFSREMEICADRAEALASLEQR